MSDPVTNVEIEDVLSSIRRLVSEDTRSAKPVTKARADRLVLTPALRVQDDAPDRPAAAPAPAPEPMLLTNPAPAAETQPPEEDADPAPLEQLLEEMAEAKDAAPDLDTLAEEMAEELAPADVPDAVDAEPNEDPAAAIQARDSFAQGMLTRLVKDELARARAPEPEADPEDDGPPEDEDRFVEALVDSVVEDVMDTGHGDAPEEAATPLPEAPEQVEEPAQAEEAARADTSLADKIAALEALVGRRDQAEAGDTGFEADPEPEEMFDAAPTFVHRPPQSLTWEDHDPEPRDEMVDHFPLGEDLGARPVATGLSVDEDALRDMVTRMIRQELQGVLGERITRNVRKLVRREIHRVIMSQEFD